MNAFDSLRGYPPDFDKFFSASPLYDYKKRPVIASQTLLQDMNYVMSLYPEAIKTLQRRVEQEIDLIDYPESFIYDSYPDKETLRQVFNSFYSNLPDAEENDAWYKHLLFILFSQEILKRRSERSSRRPRRLY